MGAEKVIANLLRVAKEDLDGARILSKQGNRNAIYLCEQAAEKVILSVVTSEGKHGGLHHLLDRMVDLVPDENPLKPLLRSIESLASFATSYRYPSSDGNIKSAPSLVEFDRHAANVARALEAAVAGFKVDLSKPNAPAGTGAPLR
ncbi:MAG: HEPN domain-containing protein [Planctomycetes bacterium]|nr:HEPN domain-containing protein [Planctomycetota bacterium]